MAIPVPTRQLFIDGEWRQPLKNNRIPIINPATEETIGNLSYLNFTFFLFCLLFLFFRRSL